MRRASHLRAVDHHAGLRLAYRGGGEGEDAAHRRPGDRLHGGDLYRASETRLTIRSRSGTFQVVSRVDGDAFDHTRILFYDAENLGIDGGGDLRVDSVAPEAVEKTFKKISTVTVEGVAVKRVR